MSLHISTTPFAHLFVLIIRCIHHSNIVCYMLIHYPCLFILIKSKILLTCFLLYLLAYKLDQINLQTLHLFNSSYLLYVKSPRIYAAHSTQTSYFTPNTLCKAHNLMSLHTYKVQNHNASTSKTWHFDTYPNPNSPCAQHFLLLICEITTHTPLKYRILYLKHDNTQCKVYHSMPLHTYTANFATSSNAQEILSNISFAHLFVLIMCEIVM